MQDLRRITVRQKRERLREAAEAAEPTVEVQPEPTVPNVHLYSCKLYWNIHFCGKGGAPSYFCGLSVYGDLYAERSRRVPRSRGRHCDEYLADHPEEQVQEHQVLRVRV